jgi:hypothetical protein
LIQRPADLALYQTLEDMDLVFGDTAAHEEKERILQIEAHLRGVSVNGTDSEKEQIAPAWDHKEI